MIRLVRTNMARGYPPERTPGPWHVLEGYGQTWCGKRPGRQVGSQHRQVEGELEGGLAGNPDLPVGPYCRPCQAAIRADRPRPFRRS
ncbi:MAG TPA: hypothetical protein VNN79_15435 [Actinomycetota bacterium]|nr:hypothetical protein [Actinomycetota bacterium]